MKRLGVALAAGLALVALTGCGVAGRAVEKAAERAAEKAAQNLVEHATGITVDTNEESATFTGPDGEQLTITGAGEEGKLVEGFPLPVHDRLTVADTMRLKANDKVGYSGSFSFEGEGTDLADYYEQILKDRAFEVTRQEIAYNDAFTIHLAAESDTESAMIMITWSEGTNEGRLDVLFGDK